MPKSATALEDVNLDEFLDGDGPEDGEGLIEAEEPDALLGVEYTGDFDGSEGLEEITESEPDGLVDQGGAAQDSERLKARIASYYINEQLRDYLLQYGNIPEAPTESYIGVGFVDIAEYSYISSWLSARENQIFLNGLYTAFHEVLKQNGGFLNKISGDSIMFHFGGIIDPATRGLGEGEAKVTIAKDLFRTCVGIQRACRLFNYADREFVEQASSQAARQSLLRAFQIIRGLRENLATMDGLNALFQVRIRVGAALGEVCIGNFGPEGARQWDVIGIPVIEARRMESTAPVDGIRVTRALYETLESCGEVDAYFNDFTDKAAGKYRQIKRHELFSAHRVVVHDKNEVSFDSYSVQANPSLPEDVLFQVNALLDDPDQGPAGLVALLKRHRGNRIVVSAMEGLLIDRGVHLRRLDLYKTLAPKRYHAALAESGDGEAEARARLEQRIRLIHLMDLLGRIQDGLKLERGPAAAPGALGDYEDAMAVTMENLMADYRGRRRNQGLRLYFESVLFPYVFASIEASVRQWQTVRRADASRLSRDRP